MRLNKSPWFKKIKVRSICGRHYIGKFSSNLQCRKIPEVMPMGLGNHFHLYSKKVSVPKTPNMFAKRNFQAEN